MLTAERIRTELEYNQETGSFTWLRGRQGRQKQREAGCIKTPDGYRRVCIDGTLYLAHRLAWLYMTDSWPADQIDHRNGIRTDNRWANLREATDAENRQNISKRIDNTSGLIGVSWENRRSKWRAYIVFGGHQKHLGMFADKHDAGIAYIKAKAEFHAFNPSMRELSI